ncbi:hypothetical protein [Streptomyces jumonjinensis]|uniref:hypothetical protein n=1 Tax=Streptomyces jumonjinensis TaxID=1945 RepID=UPI0037A7144C
MAQEHEAGPGGPDRGSEAVLLVTGVVDMALEQAEGALRRVRALLSRSDLGDLADDVRRDLVARGRNSGLDPARVMSSEPHLELLARRARTRAGRGVPGVATGARSAADRAPAAEPGHPG